jgi:hypothetical protein
MSPPESLTFAARSSCVFGKASIVSRPLRVNLRREIAGAIAAISAAHRRHCGHAMSCSLMADRLVVYKPRDGLGWHARSVYAMDGADYLLVATNGGADRSPFRCRLPARAAQALVPLRALTQDTSPSGAGSFGYQ